MLRIKEIKPVFTSIVTTCDVYTEDMYENGIIMAKKGDTKTYQTVLAVGAAVHEIHVGDQVMIDISHYAVRKYSKTSVQNDMDNNPIIKIELPRVQVDDAEGNPQDCLLLDQRDIMFAFIGEEVQGTKTPLILPKTQIIA